MNVAISICLDAVSMRATLRLKLPHPDGSQGSSRGLSSRHRQHKSDFFPMPGYVKIVEVGPRDGLQNEKSFVPTRTKIDLIKGLARA
eukprot:g77959.t1